MFHIHPSFLTFVMSPLGEYESNDQVRILPCHHFFHVLCVDPWLRSSATCPSCRGDVRLLCSRFVRNGISGGPSLISGHTAESTSRQVSPNLQMILWDSCSLANRYYIELRLISIRFIIDRYLYEYLNGNNHFEHNLKTYMNMNVCHSNRNKMVVNFCP